MEKIQIVMYDDKGSRPIIFLGKLGILSQQGGGGLANPNFLSKLPKT